MYRPLRRMSPEQHADIEQLAVTGPALPDVLQSPGLLPRSQPPLDEVCARLKMTCEPCGCVNITSGQLDVVGVTCYSVTVNTTTGR